MSEQNLKKIAEAILEKKNSFRNEGSVLIWLILSRTPDQTTFFNSSHFDCRWMDTPLRLKILDSNTTTEVANPLFPKWDIPYI